MDDPQKFPDEPPATGIYAHPTTNQLIIGIASPEPTRNDVIAEAATAAFADLKLVVLMWNYPTLELPKLLDLYRTLRDNPPT